MKTKHIHDDPRIDCPACVEFIRKPLSKTALYGSGSKSKGTTLRKVLKTVKQNARKSKHEPTYILDNANRDLSKKIKRFLHIDS